VTLEDLHASLARLLSRGRRRSSRRVGSGDAAPASDLCGAVVLQGGREIHFGRCTGRVIGWAERRPSRSALARGPTQDVLLKEGTRYLVVDSLPRMGGSGGRSETLAPLAAAIRSVLPSHLELP